MEEVNKNTELNDTDKKLHISDVMNCVFRFSELFDGYIYADDLVKKAYGVPYIEIKAKSESEAINKFKKKHSIFRSWKIKKHCS